MIEALEKINTDTRFTVVSIGKAAWRMANACSSYLKDSIKCGYVITKYGHSKGNIPGFEIFEAGHPIPDSNGIAATKYVLGKTSDMTESDTVLFLVSGGGSALFESPLEGISLEDIRVLTDKLLKSGASIGEINCVRKKLSRIKGGGFLNIVSPAKVITLSLSDVLGDDPATIASGPTVPDGTDNGNVRNILSKYKINANDSIRAALETRAEIKSCSKSDYKIIGSLDRACDAACNICRELGYEPFMLSSAVDCEAREAGKFLASIAKSVSANKTGFKKPVAFILGGETVVTIKGNGKGGRNQELSLSAAISIRGLHDVIIASVGTDGTDGPTDAAGGIVSGDSVERMLKNGIVPEKYLENNDSYTALSANGDIVKTGPTGTNVNDLMFILCK